MLKRIGVASVAVLLMAALAQAQPPGQGRGRGQGFGGFGRGGFGMGYMQLAGNEAVQTELKATDAQKTSIEELEEKQSEERRAAREQGQGGGRFNFQEFQNLSEEERNARMEQFRKDAAEREKKSREALAAILDDAQMKRLREIWVQTLGLGALSNDEIVAELKITDLQKEEIADTQQEAQRDFGEQMQGLFQRDQSDEEREAARAKMNELRKQMEEKVLANLNDDQKKQLESMKGAKFDLPQGAFGFGGGRFGQGGRRPGGDGAGGEGGGRRRPDGDGGNNPGGGNRPRRPDSV